MLFKHNECDRIYIIDCVVSCILCENLLMWHKADKPVKIFRRRKKYTTFYMAVIKAKQLVSLLIDVVVLQAVTLEIASKKF